MFRYFNINIIKDYLLLFENLIFLFNIFILAFWDKQSCLDFALISIFFFFFFSSVGKSSRTPCPLLGGDRVVSDSNQLKPHGGLPDASQKWHPGSLAKSCRSTSSSSPYLLLREASLS